MQIGDGLPIPVNNKNKKKARKKAAALSGLDFEGKMMVPLDEDSHVDT